METIKVRITKSSDMWFMDEVEVKRAAFLDFLEELTYKYKKCQFVVSNIEDGSKEVEIYDSYRE